VDTHKPNSLKTGSNRTYFRILLIEIGTFGTELSYVYTILYLQKDPKINLEKCQISVYFLLPDDNITYVS
jgi:hypothetical protein